MDRVKRICGVPIDDPDLYEARLAHLENAKKLLQASDVPLSDDPCRTCGEPCEFGHAEYPARFDADVTSELLGTVKPYQRQVVVSTGKTDWAKEVTEAEGSLAQYIMRASARQRGPSGDEDGAGGDGGGGGGAGGEETAPGVFRSGDGTGRVSILNGSHTSVSCEDDKESVLVFPDYKLVKDVERSQEGAELLWRMALDPGVARAGRRPGGGGDARSWPLPYACVILLCSHKRRDNRCHIAAPKLLTAFTHSLEGEGFEVHTQLEDPEGPSLEDMEGAADAREREFLRRLRAAVAAPEAHGKRALVLRNSHVGGHKYSGNVVIYTPQGAGVWYGRVSPHEVPAVVRTTLCAGRVLPALLRGGINLARPQGQSLLAW